MQVVVVSSKRGCHWILSAGSPIFVASTII
jgi:hypothetical protein